MAKGKFLKLRLNAPPPDLSIASIDGKVNCTYQITDTSKGEVKLFLEITIKNSASEIILDLDEVKANPDLAKDCLQIIENTSNQIELGYDKNSCVLADGANNAKLKFSFILPGKTPGTLGVKTPGTLPAVIN